MRGDQTLYAAFSTGNMYHARGPPPDRCIRCTGMHWSWYVCPAAVQAPAQVQPGFPLATTRPSTTPLPRCLALLGGPKEGRGRRGMQAERRRNYVG